MNIANNVKVAGGNEGDYKEETVKRSLSKNLNRAGYLIFDAKKAFKHLRHTFTKAPILQHFNPKRYIRIKTNA